MKKSTEESINIKKIFTEKNKENFDEENNVEETTGKGLSVNHRASHKGKIGNKLKKEDEIKEMSGLSKTVTHQSGNKTTNIVSNEKIVREHVRKMLHNSYLLNDDTKK